MSPNQFTFTNQPELEKNLFNLLCLANFVIDKELESACVKLIYNNMTEENVFEILQSEAAQTCPALTKTAIQYISWNWANVAKYLWSTDHLIQLTKDTFITLLTHDEFIIKEDVFDILLSWCSIQKNKDNNLALLFKILPKGDRLVDYIKLNDLYKEILENFLKTYEPKNPALYNLSIPLDCSHPMKNKYSMKMTGSCRRIGNDLAVEFICDTLTRKTELLVQFAYENRKWEFIAKRDVRTYSAGDYWVPDSFKEINSDNLVVTEYPISVFSIQDTNEIIFSTFKIKATCKDIFKPTEMEIVIQ